MAMSDFLFPLLKKVSRKPIRYVTIHFQDRSIAASLQHKIDPKSALCVVNESPIRYVFGAGTRAIRYSVDIDNVLAFPCHTSEFMQQDG